MDKKFNLIDEKWIPTNIGWASIKDCFIDNNIYQAGRTSTEKICFIKFLLAIAQATDDYEYNEDIYDMTISEFKDKILNYLDNHYEDFYFYGDKPFLQFNQYLNYEKNGKNFFIKINTIDETVCSGDNSIVHDSQFKICYSDIEKAIQLIVNLGAPCIQKIYSGKKPIIFTSTLDYIKSPKKDGKQSVNVFKGLFNNYEGLLHSFVTGKSILETAYVNLISCEDLEHINKNITEIGKPPWEINNLVEDHEYKNTYYSYLIPMNRFILFFEDDDENCFYSDGIYYDDEWMRNQPSIYTVSYKKINKKNETEENTTLTIKPSLNESVICSLVNFWIHKKAQNYNFMKSKKIIEEANLNENDFCVEYLGCNYEINSGMNYLINYVHEIIPFNSNFYKSYNYDNFSNFIAQVNGCVNTWKDERTKELQKFCDQFYDNRKDRKSNISIEEDFEIECKKLIKQAEIRAISNDCFEVENELKIFKKNAKSILIDIYGLKNSFKRGKKLEILSKIKSDYLHF
jgi:hypothetical protein